MRGGGKFCFLEAHLEVHFVGRGPCLGLNRIALHSRFDIIQNNSTHPRYQGGSAIEPNAKLLSGHANVDGGRMMR